MFGPGGPLEYVREGDKWITHGGADPLTTDQIVERVASRWDLSIPFPTPKFGVRCMCGSSEFRTRYWLFHTKELDGLPHRLTKRMDVGVKCLFCGFIAVFGVPIPESWWNYWGHEPGRVQWQQALERSAFLTEEFPPYGEEEG